MIKSAILLYINHNVLPNERALSIAKSTLLCGHNDQRWFLNQDELLCLTSVLCPCSVVGAMIRGDF